MLRSFLSFLLFITIISSVFSQEFSIKKQIEINPINNNVFYDYFEKFQCKNRTVVPLIPLYDTDFDTLFFLTIDSSNNVQWLQWKCEKDKDGDSDVCTKGVCLLNNEMLLMSQYYLYRVKQKGNKLKTVKRIKLPQKENFDFESIYQINGNSSNHILLVNTYNFSRSDTLHDVFRLAKYNFKKKKIEESLTLDVGKGIFLSHFSYQWVTTSNHNIAVAHPCKPEIYLFNNNLSSVDTIVVDYPEIYKTKNFLDSILTNNLILKNKYKTANLIKLLNEKKIVRFPKIEKIAFINEDLLFILIQPDISINSKNWSKNKLHFIYSISNQEFYETKGLLSNFNIINSSQPLMFANNCTVNLSDSVDSKNEYKYYATISKLSIDFQSKYMDAIDLQVLPPFSMLENNSSSNTVDYSNYSYIMVADYSACSHCKFDDKFKNVLVLHVFSDTDRHDKATKLFYIKKYEQMFNSVSVYFCTDSLLNFQNLKKNHIYKMECD